MTDNDIKKSIEWHLNSETNCDECSYKDFKETNGNCVGKMLKDAFDLINSKDEIIKAQADNIFLLESALKDKTAEIERLQECLETSNNVIKNTFLLKAGLNNDIFAEIKSEAIKEFAERLKNEYADFDELHEEIRHDNLIFAIDNLVKEMTEVNENG